jgi:GGDEF domain-containing protein
MQAKSLETIAQRALAVLAAACSFVALALVYQSLDVFAIAACAIAAFAAIASAMLSAVPGTELTPDVIEKAGHLAEQRRRLVIYDPQTGLLARWYFERRFEEECSRAARYKEPLSLLVIEFGGVTSAELTQSLAGWLLRHVRMSDLLGHGGDDRFLLGLTNTNREGGRVFASRVSSSFNSVQVGLVSFPDDGETLSALIERATNVPAQQAA